LFAEGVQLSRKEVTSMYIETIDQMTKEEWRKSFYLGRYLYDYESSRESKENRLFRRTAIMRAKNHINSFVARYDLNVPEVIDFTPKDVLDPLMVYNINYQSVAWAGYFTYAILLSMHNEKDQEGLRDKWVKILSYSLAGNPGYSSAFYDNIDDHYKQTPKVRECFRRIMKDSYYDTYAVSYDDQK